ncbi:PREDICTED: succinyl-CoA:3-ketoacid coenzyme A transferase 1, mitochondrial-like [Nicrophorus vespilloides]|uniref:Succinyl-CoA:3-ketoacid-coenzyme A transferase n=1 Tax=Nicrophorus vespilloides TaxID=110193 RepID=A0ABM1NIF3_NICVS|nr:PREDICTED: succinyl-CoA:3-ketoacid coenzyme A transferase 1, mitochondrial-like [Nicrophorus vespilloides]
MFLTINRAQFFLKRFSSGVNNKIYPSAQEAIEDVSSFSQLLFGGYGICGIAENLIEALRKHPSKDYSVVTIEPGLVDYGLGLLLNEKKIKKMILSFMAANPQCIRQYLNGELEAEFSPQGTLSERLRAGGAGIPAFYTATAVGTLMQTGGCPMKYNEQGLIVKESVPKSSKIIDGKEYILEKAIVGDYAFIRGWKADKLGNVVFRKSARNLNVTAAKAAKITIVEVEEIVDVGELDPDDIHLPGIYVQRVVKGDKYLKPIQILKVHDENNSRLDPIHERIAQRAALEIRNGMFVNLGIGLPLHIPSHVPSDVEYFVQSDNGIIGVGPYPTWDEIDPDLVNAGRETTTVIPGASFFSSDESFAMIRGGHIDMTVLGGLEVSQYGDLANWMIPGKFVNGMGGAMDLVSGPNTKVLICMQHNNKDGKPKIVEECTLPLTGAKCVDMIITEKCVFEVNPGRGLVLVDLQEGVSLAEVVESTAASFEVSPNVRQLKQRAYQV